MSASRHAGVTHQLAHDLRIGLAVEAMLARTGRAEVLLERLEDGAPSRAVGPQDGPVDVEQHDATGAAGSGAMLSDW